MKISITAGGTLEKIDSVRTITNNSTGEMGLKMTREWFEKVIKWTHKLHNEGYTMTERDL